MRNRLKDSVAGLFYTLFGVGLMDPNPEKIVFFGLVYIGLATALYVASLEFKRD